MNDNKEIFLCAICNIESGTCNEDCKFCTQSVKYKADIQRYKKKLLNKLFKKQKEQEKIMQMAFVL